MSEVCEGAELQPSVFYGWQRHLFCSILDGYNRAVVASNFAARMTEADIELIRQRARFMTDT